MTGHRFSISLKCSCNTVHGKVCEDCGYCGYCGSIHPAFRPRTQKGKGLGELSHAFAYSTQILNPFRFLRTPILPGGCDVGLTAPALKGGRIFARPCPSRPRHGYIESRVVKSIDEINTLLAEVLADDPEGELMLTHKIEARQNAIWTPNLLTVGKGHDGATAGKSTLSIPLFESAWKTTLAEATLKNAGVLNEEWPYIEAVTDEKGQVTLTQLRAGPAGEGLATGDYIPSTVVVEKILLPTNYADDLMKWEKDIHAATPGTVIYHPGGSPIDHFSVHARTFKLPVVYSRQPEIGETLTPSPTLPVMDPESVLRGVVLGTKIPLPPSSYSSAAAFALLALHHSIRFHGEEGEWLGVGAALMCRLGIAAILGERRHIKTKHGKREDVYDKVLNLPLNRLRVKVPRTINLFRYAVWPSAAIGGPKWAYCGTAIMDLLNAIQALAQSPTAEGVGGVVRAYNTAINQAHNGGWWFNKFISLEAFEEIPANNPVWVLQVMPVIDALQDTATKTSTQALQAGVAGLKKWRPLTLRPPAAMKVEIGAMKGVSALSFQIHFPPPIGAGNWVYLSNVSLQDILNKAGMEAWLVEDGEGYRLDLRLPNSPTPLTAWVDQNLHTSALTKDK